MINVRDTHIGKSEMSIEEREVELRKIWEDFSRSRVVITDRLHGMIFAFITVTPALVLPNSNFKVEKCYEWIKDCGFIKFISKPTNDKILSALNFQYSNSNFQNSHDCILRDMKCINSYVGLN